MNGFSATYIGSVYAQLDKIIARCFAKKSQNPDSPHDRLVKLSQQANNHGSYAHVTELIDELFSILWQNEQVNSAFLSPDFRKEYLDAYLEQKPLGTRELSQQIPEALTSVVDKLQTASYSKIAPILGRIVAAGMKIQN